MRVPLEAFIHECKEGVEGWEGREGEVCINIGMVARPGPILGAVDVRLVEEWCLSASVQILGRAGE